MISIDKILQGRSSFSRYFLDQSLLSMLKTNWPEIAGKLADVLIISHYRKGVLHLVTDNYMWATEIAFYQDQLIDKMNKFLKEKGKRFKVFAIRIIYQEKVVLSEKELQIERNLSLEDKIKKRNEAALAEGKRVCRHCGVMFTNDICCAFCRLEMRL